MRQESARTECQEACALSLVSSFAIPAWKSSPHPDTNPTLLFRSLSRCYHPKVRDSEYRAWRWELSPSATSNRRMHEPGNSSNVFHSNMSSTFWSALGLCESCRDKLGLEIVLCSPNRMQDRSTVRRIMGAHGSQLPGVSSPGRQGCSDSHDVIQV